MIDGNTAMNSHNENMSEKDMEESYEWYENEKKKEAAIKFAEWIRYNDWESTPQEMGKWYKKEGERLTRKTTEQLYELFLNSTKQ